MAELANCARCGNVFVKQLRDICHDCYKEEEAAFQKVYRFLMKRENRKATMMEIVEATGVDEMLIQKFIKEKRLLVSRFPNLGYPCERCGKKITAGSLCTECQNELKKELEMHDELEKRAEEIRKQQEKEKIHTYFSIDKHKR